MQKINYAEYQKPSDYMKFDQGDNRIRIISEGFMGLQHGLRTARGWVNLGECTGKDCEHCLKSNVPKRFWKWIVVDRLNEEVRLLDAGIMIGDQICNIAKKLEGQITKHDLIVNRIGNDRQTKYTVRQAPESQPISQDNIERWKAAKTYIQVKYLGEAAK